MQFALARILTPQQGVLPLLHLGLELVFHAAHRTFLGHAFLHRGLVGAQAAVQGRNAEQGSAQQEREHQAQCGGHACADGVVGHFHRSAPKVDLGFPSCCTSPAT